MVFSIIKRKYTLSPQYRGSCFLYDYQWTLKYYSWYQFPSVANFTWLLQRGSFCSIWDSTRGLEYKERKLQGRLFGSLWFPVCFSMGDFQTSTKNRWQTNCHFDSLQDSTQRLSSVWSPLLLKSPTKIDSRNTQYTLWRILHVVTLFQKEQKKSSCSQEDSLRKINDQAFLQIEYKVFKI